MKKQSDRICFAVAKMEPALYDLDQEMLSLANSFFTI
jgi:hypothetical protein